MFSEMTEYELKDKLIQLGWKISKNHFKSTYNDIGWYAWTSLKDIPNCECNEKPPSLIIEPYQAFIGEEQLLRSVEFRLTGESKGRWYSLNLYSVPFHETEEVIPDAIKNLSAAWAAITEQL